jgi:S-adenosylmethionine-diacylgycerolhomoserine-N-methlytransferase
MSAADALADFRILWHMLRGQPRHGDSMQRLEAFYAPQADHYDAFRARLLQGRGEMIQMLAPPPHAHVVELGCGTGANLAHLADRLDRLDRVDLVDLCPSLLAKARQRVTSYRNVEVILADACSYAPGRPVDCVYFSYALTMIPDWRGALDNALRMLRPGGRLGLVDFHLPRPGGFANHFWQRWFAHDGVYLSADHLPELRARLPDHVCQQRSAAVPYLPGLRVPYYLFVGEKP